MLSVRDLHVHFPARGGWFGRSRGVLRAVDGVSFDLTPGEMLGIIGDSGCGKSTLARAILRLTPPTSGEILFERHSLLTLPRRDLRRIRRQIQVVFQDPMSSLNPRMRIADIVAEPLTIHRVGTLRQRQGRAAAMLERVGLTADHLDRYPHEFSGGQRQRIGIARALVGDPALVIFDEPISALDVTIATQILDLIRDLKKSLHLTGLFIAHQLGAVRNICTRVAVMHGGKIVEIGPVEEVYSRPQHPYTQALLAACHCS